MQCGPFLLKYFIHLLAPASEVPLLYHSSQFLNHRQHARVEIRVGWFLPAQVVDGQAAHIEWIDPPLTKRLDEGDAITQVVVAYEIEVGSNECPQVVAESQVDWWTVVQGTNAHVEDVLRRFGGLARHPVNKIRMQLSGGQNAGTARCDA